MAPKDKRSDSIASFISIMTESPGPNSPADAAVSLTRGSAREWDSAGIGVKDYPWVTLVISNS